MDSMISQNVDQTPPQQVRQHGVIARVFHWGFIVVFIYALTKQLDSVDQLADAALLRFEMLFAIGFLLLLAVRFAYMRLTMPTVLPVTAPPKMKRMAKIGHLAMYSSLAMIAISGLMIGGVYAHGTPDGVAMTIALFLHEVSVLATYLAIALHIAAALYHRLKGDGIWTAMVPIWKER